MGEKGPQPHQTRRSSTSSVTIPCSSRLAVCKRMRTSGFPHLEHERRRSAEFYAASGSNILSSFWAYVDQSQICRLISHFCMF